MYPEVLVVFVLSCGCTACVFTGHPESTVTEVGETATLTCSTDFTRAICSPNGCAIHWERKSNNTFKEISVCTVVYPRYTDRYSVSSGAYWSLTITGVQPSDARRYRCSIYSNERQNSEFSPPLSLIIPSLIDISVQPPRLPILSGDNAAFYCNVQSRGGALPTLIVNWFVNGTEVRILQNQSFYHTDNDGQTLTFLKISINYTNVYCQAFSETKYMKSSDRYQIIIHHQRKPITFTTQVYETVETTTVNPAEFPHDTDEPSATQVPETEESLTVNPAEFPHDTDEPFATQVPKTEKSQLSPGSKNSLNTVYQSTTPVERNIQSVTRGGAPQSTSTLPSTNSSHLNITDSSLDYIILIFVGEVITALCLMLVISFLVYCLVFKKKSKAAHNARSASTTQDDGGESNADGILEIQLHGVTPRCDRHSYHTSSAEERSVEPPRETVTVVVTSD